MMDSYIKILFAFGAVLGLLLIFYGFAMRRRQAERSLINIIAYRVLDPRRGVAVAVMKIGGELLFIGITPSDMKVLKTLSDTELKDESSEVRRQKIENLSQTSDFYHLTSLIRKRLHEDN